MARTINEALDILSNTSPKIITDKQYWLNNYNKLQNVDYLILQMANYIEPYKEIVITPKIEYYETPNKTRILCSDISNFHIGVALSGVANSQLNTKLGLKNAINGTFFYSGKDNNGKIVYYSTSILYIDYNGVKGVQGSWVANHSPCKQSCLIKYKDNTIVMKRLLNISEIQSELPKIEFVLGGIGLYQDGKLLRYEDEGFVGVFADVARKADKTLIGVNTKTKKVYLVTRPSIANREKKNLLGKKLYDLEDLAKDLALDYGVNLVLQLDGGNSTAMIKDSKTIISSGRVIHSYCYFG